MLYRYFVANTMQTWSGEANKADLHLTSNDHISRITGGFIVALPPCAPWEDTLESACVRACVRACARVCVGGWVSVYAYVCARACSRCMLTTCGWNLNN